MPMHDWTRVTSGTYHNWHYLWLAAILDCLNGDILPQGWFAMAEQRVDSKDAPASHFFRLRFNPSDEPFLPLAPPRATLIEQAERVRYARKTNRIAIHHALGTVVAVIELISPGNKDSRSALRSFARKAAALLRHGIHLSVVDPFPPGRYDPHGIHRAIRECITQEASVFETSADKPLTQVAYQAGEVPTAYVEPFAVGAALPDLPLFLDEDYYVMVPLEETYQATWNVLPRILRDLVASPT